MRKILLNIQIQIELSDKKLKEIGLTDGTGEVKGMNSSHPRKSWSGKEQKLGEFVLKNTFKNNSRLLISAKALQHRPQTQQCLLDACHLKEVTT